MLTRTRFAWLLTLAACGGSSSEAKAPARASAPAPASALASAPAPAPVPAPEPADLLVVSPPPSAGCTLASDAFEAPYALEIAPTPEGERFAWLTRGEVKLTALDRGQWFVEATTGGATVRGYVSPQVPVRATRPIVFGGYLVARPEARLSLTSVADGHATVLAPDLEIDTNGKPLSESVPCADLSLGEARFDAASALPAGKALRTSNLPNKDVPLALSPTAAPVAKIRASWRSREVEITALQGARARIVWTQPTGIVFGWVDAALLTTKASSPQAVFSIPEVTVDEADRMPPRDAPEHRTCDGEVRLIAESHRQGRVKRWVVGSFAPKTRIAIYERDEALAYVNPPDGAAVSFAIDARLAVAARDVAACAMH
jgi:hypothetical protein